MKTIFYRLFCVMLCAALSATLACSKQGSAQQETALRVLPGIDVLLQQKIDLVRGKRVGLITNPTGVTANLASTIDVLHAHPEVTLVALFGPEHGVRGSVPAGEHIAHFVDERTGVPVYSLYGAQKAPSPEMLNNVDVLLFDIQDVGVRPYTYIYTMAFAMQAAQQNNLPFVVLDRPNPLGGELVEGPMLEEEFSSFIGLYPIPYLHGLTIGELASFFNREFDIHANLIVVPMQSWRRNMAFAATGLPWVPTSPHVPHETTPFYLAATGGLGELQVVNEGVGYTSPFEYIGAPWIDAHALAEALNVHDLDGVHFRPVHYKPYYGGKAGTLIHGVQIHVINYQAFRPIKTQLAILKTVHDLYPGQRIFNPLRLDMFHKAMGTDIVDKMIQNDSSLKDIYAACAYGVDVFVKKRKMYFLYD